MKCARTLVLASAALMLSAAAWGQISGTLAGSVADQTGAGIPGAKVSLFLRGGNTPVVQTATTVEGIFRIPAVRPDFYNLVVEAQGFNKTTIDGVKVNPSTETALPPVVVQVASATESVEVSAATVALQTSSIEVATIVTQAQVQNL